MEWGWGTVIENADEQKEAGEFPPIFSREYRFSDFPV